MIRTLDFNFLVSYSPLAGDVYLFGSQKCAELSAAFRLL